MAEDVAIVGAGPVGLMLANELRIHGIDVVLYDRLPVATGESRAIGYTRRAAEVFQMRGLMDHFGAFSWGKNGHFGGIGIDYGPLEDNHYGIRGVHQSSIEAALGTLVQDRGAVLRRGWEVVGLRPTGTGAVLELDTPAGRVEREHRFVVGCDGGRSTVRKLAGIDFVGRGATRGMYLADIRGQDIRSRAVGERVPGGMVLAFVLEEGAHRIVIHEHGLVPKEDLSTLTFEEIADSWERMTGQDIHGAEHTWFSAFTDTTRMAAEFRRGPVFLAGDSAHIHIPAGGQGLSVGVQDAANLGWKLAAEIQGWAPDGLLDTYHAERAPVVHKMLQGTLAGSLLYLTGDEMEPVRVVFRELAALHDGADHLAGIVSGLNVHYDVGATGHPLLGYRLNPDRLVERADGTRTTVNDLLLPARGVLVDTSGSAEVREQAAGWADRVDLVTGRWVPAGDHAGPAAPAAVLLRPDGHVAWVTPGGGDLAGALGRWFGAARVLQS